MNSSTAQILGNVEIKANDEKGRKYFDGSMKFMGTLTSILDMLINRVKRLAVEDINDANVSQMWGILLLLLVMGLSPILMIMAKNAISSIQVRDYLAMLVRLYYILFFFYLLSYLLQVLRRSQWK